ncbi:hypothetical protein, partial [Listeria monocytogenes]|uniref:hypothetical protein n=1 Tax=Listeria monocytogenes TaxID=1639 RepID=UPI002FDC5500
MKLTDKRFLVIADYPNSPFKIGEVITLTEIYPYSGLSYIMGSRVVAPEWFEKHSHLFKPLA